MINLSQFLIIARKFTILAQNFIAWTKRPLSTTYGTTPCLPERKYRLEHMTDAQMQELSDVFGLPK